MFHKLKEYLMHYSWDLAYARCQENGSLKGEVVLSDLHYIKNPYKNKWFADPFIIEEDDIYLHLLVEEYDYEIQRGRLAHLIVDKTEDIIIECKIVLSSDTHLSFPAIYHFQGEIYVHPENSESGASYMYRYDRVKDELVNPIKIIDQPLTDAIINCTNGRYEMFSTVMPNPNGKVLSRYVSDSLFGPYRKIDDIYMSSAYARMGGYFYKLGDKTLRVAQNCNGAYGKGILFIDEDKIIGYLTSKNWKYAGIHTFNTLGNRVVLDLKKYDFPLIYKLKTILKNEDLVLY